MILLINLGYMISCREFSIATDDDTLNSTTQSSLLDTSNQSITEAINLSLIRENLYYHVLGSQ